MLKKKICLVGHFGVGKTSLLRRFVDNMYEDTYLTTVGVVIRKKDSVVASKPLTMMLWDMAGKDDLAEVKLSHLTGASGYILVADGCRAVTLATAVQLQEKITQLFGPLPFVLAVNKSDLAPKWELQRSDIEACGWTSFDTSAKLGTGVEEMFMGLAEKLVAGDPGE